MKKELRRAGFVSLTLGALGCGEPARPEGVAAQELFKKDVVAADSREGDGWKRFLDAKTLHRAWAPPAESPWRPYYKPTLIAAVATVQSAAMPVKTAGTSALEAQAAGFAQGWNLRNTAVFVDLTGEESVAWAAVLRRKGMIPVLTINNWPHQAGLLALERPLGALLYYADEMSRVLPAETAAALPESRPVFILERSRLGQKGLTPTAKQFDNRYFHARTDFPSAEVLRSRGIESIVYVNPRGTTAGCEEDDLADYFADLSKAGLTFAYARSTPEAYEIAVVVPVARETIFTPQAVAEYSSTTTTRPSSYHSYGHYHVWHTSYWTRSSGAWGGSGATGSGSSSGYSSGSHSSGFSS